MKVKELIRQLQEFDPEARVYLSTTPMREGEKEVLWCGSYKNGTDKSLREVILEDATQFDVTNEIDAMFDYYLNEYIDEIDGYQDMCDKGYTPDVVSEYYDEYTGKHMKQFCDEHGIDY